MTGGRARRDGLPSLHQGGRGIQARSPEIGRTREVCAGRRQVAGPEVNWDQETYRQQDEDLKCLDKLIADFGGSSDAGQRSRGPCDLLLEHLQAARRYLLGSMPGEYSLSLQQAKESVAYCILDKNARAETKRILRSLIGSEVPKQQAGVTGRFSHLLPSPVPLTEAPKPA